MSIPRRIVSLVSLVSLLSLSLACNRSDPPQALAAGSRTRKARIYLVSMERGKATGPEIGCGGRLEALEVELPVPTPALQGSLEALLDADQQYQGAGFYNSLANSPLKIERIERSGGKARIDLSGYLELGGECDGSRVLEQLTETATQFRDVTQAEFFLGGKPLRKLLSGRGS